jgi:hypothetical protein
MIKCQLEGGEKNIRNHKTIGKWILSHKRILRNIDMRKGLKSGNRNGLERNEL